MKAEYEVLYRELSGSVRSARVTAENETAARWIFFRRYDGRIITVTRISEFK